MLSYNELKKGTIFILDKEPWEVLEYNFLRMQQRKPVAATKIKNLLTGKIVSRNFHQNESFEEAEIKKQEIVFLYAHREEYWFSKADSPKERFLLGEDIIGEAKNFLKQNEKVTAKIFDEKIIGIALPIKMEFKIREAPPAVKGNTAQGGLKTAILENGLQVNVPLFVKEGDIVRINTNTGEYVERVIR